MKTKLTTAIFSLAAVFGFAQNDPFMDQFASALSTDLKPVEKQVRKDSFTYVRMSIADSDTLEKFEALPGLGIGYRYGMQNSAIDWSANYTRQVDVDQTEENYVFTAPKISYLRYWSPAKDQSFYYGAGLAWGGIKKSGQETFNGVIPSATLGYELNRNQAWRSFFQLDVSQPAAAITTSSISFDNLPKTLAEVSFGLGF